jgi:hypothetical protein
MARVFATNDSENLRSQLVQGRLIRVLPYFAFTLPRRSRRQGAPLLFSDGRSDEITDLVGKASGLTRRPAERRLTYPPAQRLQMVTYNI